MATTDKIVPKKPRKADSKKLFLDRLRFEGRYEEYEQTIRDVMIELSTTSLLKCQHPAMLRCGMRSPDEERKLASDRGELAPAVSEVVVTDTQVDDRLLASLGLPQSAHPTVELEWVRSHPLMVMANDKQVVKILLSHVMSPPHGKAPSVTAVSMLGYYARKPGELYSMLAKLARDGASQGGSAESDHDIAEIAKLIREVKGA